MKLITYIATALTAATLLLSNKATAESIETMAGDKSVTVDLKANANLAPRTNLFTRNRVTIDYQNKVNYFGLADVSVNLVDGLDAVVETQFVPNTGVIPRLGIQYFAQFGDFSVYTLATVGLSANPDGEFQQIFAYKPNVADSVNFVLSAENITNIGAQGHTFSLQRLRTGVALGKLGNYELGFAADLTELGKEKTPLYNVGGFGKVSF